MLVFTFHERVTVPEGFCKFLMKNVHNFVWWYPDRSYQILRYRYGLKLLFLIRNTFLIRLKYSYRHQTILDHTHLKT